MTGHVYVVAGDITKVGCDAWLLPTDGAFRISGSFAEAVGVMPNGLLKGHEWGDSRVTRYRESPDVGPEIWLANVGLVPNDPENDPSWFLDVVEPFASAAKSRQKPATDLPPRLAIPVLGTGEGGMDAAKGGIYRSLLPEMQAVAEEHDVDLMLVCWGRRSFSAAQRVRRDLLVDRSLADLWDMGPKTDELVVSARQLGEVARDGQMVLFLGAGASAGAGFPTWQKLLDDISDEAELSVQDREALRRLDVRDQATILRTRLKNSTLHKVISDRMKATEYGLTQGLLASLPVQEAVTTNYDTLFEAACGAIDNGRPAVLPYEAAAPGQRWLLKLHGCVGQDGSTVLTRADYLDIPSRHGALFGLVQAMLMTRHMFFVGYSLSDEDFHQLIHEVRVARQGDPSTAAEGGLGTTLTLFDDPLFEELWRHDVNVVPVASRPECEPGTDAYEKELAQASRWAQIFLDLVGFESADLDGYLLDHTYEDLLDPGEKALAGLLRDLGKQDLASTHAGDRVRKLLREFGLPISQPEPQTDAPLG